MKRPLVTTWILGIVGIVLASIVLSKLYWGYYLFPPPVDARLLEANEVVSATVSRVEVTKNGERHNEVLRAGGNEGPWWAEVPPRGPRLLADRGISCRVASMRDGDRYDRLLRAVIVASEMESGVADLAAIEIMDDAQEVLVWVIASPLTKSDHKQLFEMVFEEQTAVGKWLMLDRTMHFQDSAQWEGIEWYTISGWGSAFWTSAVLAFVLIVRTTKTARKGMCLCGYALIGLQSDCCPECGRSVLGESGG